jgi:DNA-binding NarL/FixJ family response regulator
MTLDILRTGRTAVLMEPHPICHAAIGSLLARVDISVVGAATTACATHALLEGYSPNLLLAEVDLPEGRKAALGVISRGRRANPALTVVVLSGSDDPDLIDDAFAAGVSEYILKTSDPDAVENAIQRAFEPSIYLPRARHARLVGSTATRGMPQLTRRELEILRLVSEGRSNRQVGQLLWVTDQTVKFHLANIYRKLGVGSRHEAARWAHEHGVLELTLREIESGEIVSLIEGNGTGNGNGSSTAPAPVPPRRRTTRSLRPRGLREGTSQ